MKTSKLLIMIATVATLTACETIKTNTFTQAASALNYQQIGGSDMFLTESNSVNSEYTPIASLIVYETTGRTVENVEYTERIAGSEIYGTTPEVKIKQGKNRYANMASALAFAVKTAKEMGGNGIINIKTDMLFDEFNIPKTAIITGMVIKK